MFRLTPAHAAGLGCLAEAVAAGWAIRGRLSAEWSARDVHGFYESCSSKKTKKVPSIRVGIWRRFAFENAQFDLPNEVL